MCSFLWLPILNVLRYWPLFLGSESVSLSFENAVKLKLHLPSNPALVPLALGARRLLDVTEHVANGILAIAWMASHRSPDMDS